MTLTNFPVSMKVLCLLLACLVLITPVVAKPRPADSPPQGSTSGLEATDYLINGDMDQLAFYPRPTNHYVAGQWFEWWGNYNTIPEYIDGGIPGHNECYPEPLDGSCHSGGPSNSSQGLIRWGSPFVAGIYQPVDGVTPCVPYTFEIYNRNDAGAYHPRIAIDPTGWIITRPGGSKPENCPPDGSSPCPDPYIGNGHGFPSTIVWSAESNHPAYTWSPISLTVEAQANRISVWTYTAPEHTGPMTTYWDYGSVTQGRYPNDRLPEPDTIRPSGFITNLTTTLIDDTLSITWQTPSPASTQVWYEMIALTPPMTPTESMTYTSYMPIIYRDVGFAYYTSITEIEITPKTYHQAIINDLPENHKIRFIALSRHLEDGWCTTEMHGPIVVHGPTTGSTIESGGE